MPTSLIDRLQLPAGPVSLADHDPSATPGLKGGKAEGKAALEAMDPELFDLEEKLLAGGYVGDPRRVLVVLQGMDTSGKGGVLKHAAGVFNPSALRITSFGKPTEEERAHDFLWRVERAVPAAGRIGFFDRSHYEDVLIQRVHQMAEPAEIERRYGAINDFEQRLVEAGTTVVKCMLHISPDTQKERLLSRLETPHKQWKFNPGDVDERAVWPAYTEAYEIALERCNTEAAPWFVVPSDHKWYRNWAVATLALEALRGLDLGWPKPSYDVDVQRARLVGETW
ncbi:polyphosphate kinase 2 family protein [Nocardioides mangrovicus]|uniref:Polyphosphate kinase 2 family protein n=1 Tax=Nocardioides mangrovicus TaxID=2478913 RepID=A0A3L8P2L1_9ACTN|nr:PPK2 family polyphosphate kinase [Nocardioides mangrovicus]RLV49202.1 polyphosphate kinase 2 family protein [Nocardioides mangrovicus]